MHTQSPKDRLSKRKWEEQFYKEIVSSQHSNPVNYPQLHKTNL